MGMFDYVDLGPHAIKCPFCGAVVTGYQTKDSPDQLLTTYRVSADGLVESAELCYEDDHPFFQAVPADFCGVWDVYGDCPRGCKSIIKNAFGEPFEISMFHAQLVIMDGKLHRVKPVNHE